MMKYELTCTCGDVMSVEASSQAEAVDKMKEIMNEDAVKAHFAEKHAGEMVPPLSQVQMMIEQQLRPA